MQICRVEIMGAPDSDPVFESFQIVSMPWRPKHNADSVRLWAKYFAPMGHLDVLVDVPHEWAPFFTAMLLSPTHFVWAKQFLASKAWAFFQHVAPNGGSFKFHFPPGCPLDKAPTCSNWNSYDFQEPSCRVPTAPHIEDSQPVQSAHSTPTNQGIDFPTISASTSNLHIKRKMPKKAPIFDTEVICSARVQEMNNGLKKDSSPDRNCFACLATPPILSNKVIRNLGTSLCKVPEKNLQDDKLTKKHTTKAVIGSSKNEDSSSASQSPNTSTSKNGQEDKNKNAKRKK
uniref:Uncharacterized protein n=1 Tax=Arundo donax TaxID=35708 RepID=A0A0A9UFK7_ARUDO